MITSTKANGRSRMICNTAQCFIIYDKRTLRKHGMSTATTACPALGFAPSACRVASAAVDLLIQYKVADLFSSNEARFS